MPYFGALSINLADVNAYAQLAALYATRQSLRDRQTARSPALHTPARTMASCRQDIPVGHRHCEIPQPATLGYQQHLGPDGQPPRSSLKLQLLPRSARNPPAT